MNAGLSRHWIGALLGPAMVLALAAALCLPLPGCKSRTGKPTPPTGAAGEKSPKELAVADFLGEMNLQGKPVLIEFGTVGCQLSDKGLDNMIAVQKADSIPGLAMVRVEGSSDAAANNTYYKTKALSFPVYRDQQSALAKSLSATSYPTFVLVDKYGHIRYQGKYPQESLEFWGTTLVAETKDPGSAVGLFGAKTVDVAKYLANKLPDLKGDVKPLSEYAGEGGLLLLFVDTSCPFSSVALKEMPLVAQALAKQKINCLLVNNDESKETVQEFYAKNPFGAPVVYDTGAATRDQWNVHSVPIAVFITPARTIGYQGEAVWANMGSAIEKSLGLAADTIKFTVEGTGFG